MCYSHDQMSNENNNSRLVRPAGIISGLLYDAVRFYQNIFLPLRWGLPAVSIRPVALMRLRPCLDVVLL